MARGRITCARQLSDCGENAINERGSQLETIVRKQRVRLTARTFAFGGTGVIRGRGFENAVLNGQDADRFG
jgi:hypothetical protein